MRKLLIAFGALALFAMPPAFATNHESQATDTEGTIGDDDQPVSEAVEVTEPVRTFVMEQDVAPVVVEGDVAIGTALPETVTLVEVPDYEYRLAVVNDQRVLVNPETRQVVYVFPAE